MNSSLPLSWSRRLARIAFALAGILTIPFWLIHPAAADPRAPAGPAMFDAMQQPAFAAVNRGFIFIVLACLLAITSFYVTAAARVGKLGFLGTQLATVGSALFVGLGVVNGFVAPLLAPLPEVHDMVTVTGAISNSGFGPLMALAGLTFAVGHMLVGYAAQRSGDWGKLPAWLLILSVPVLGLSPLMPLVVRTVGCAAFGASYIWIGLSLRPIGSDR